jgi:hypothetical protein
MNKALQVTICLEFDGIDDADSDAADEIIGRLTNACMNMEQRYEAAAVWVNNAVIVSSGHEVAKDSRIDELEQKIQGEGCEDTCDIYREELNALRGAA